jgi:hypothetical protein
VGEQENEGDDNILHDDEKRKRAPTTMTDGGDDEDGNKSDVSECIGNGDSDQMDEGVNVLESSF